MVYNNHISGPLNLLKFSSAYPDTACKVSVFGVVLVRIFPHMDLIDRMRENTDQSNSEYQYFLRSVISHLKQK